MSYAKEICGQAWKTPNNFVVGYNGYNDRETSASILKWSTLKVVLMCTMKEKNLSVEWMFCVNLGSYNLTVMTDELCFLDFLSMDLWLSWPFPLLTHPSSKKNPIHSWNLGKMSSSDLRTHAWLYFLRLHLGHARPFNRCHCSQLGTKNFQEQNEREKNTAADQLTALVLSCFLIA